MSEATPPPSKPRGRGAGDNPEQRFASLHVVYDEGEAPTTVKTKFLVDHASTILTRNNSPDLPFEVSLNPYRGCEHGCAYCYARPTHEYLGFSSGLDFESRIMVKPEAAELLRSELLKPSYKPSTLACSGVTDPYQPVEKKLRITRSCLEVLAETRHPVAIVTKNHLVTRDIDLLQELARHQAVLVYVSITSLDPDLARILEPRASSPSMRLEAVRQLAEAGIPVGVSLAPVIPAINDEEIPAILKAGAEAGASFAASTIVRLPFAVKEIFTAWLEEHYPQRVEKVLGRIRAMQGETLSHREFGKRLRGEGIWAEQIRALFQVSKKRNGLDQPRPPLNVKAFRRPADPSGQMDLAFD
jgi:DNA repair photolyase